MRSVCMHVCASDKYQRRVPLGLAVSNDENSATAIVHSIRTKGELSFFGYNVTHIFIRAILAHMIFVYCIIFS